MSEYSYLNLMKKILLSGVDKDDRTGTGTYSTFGKQLIFDMSEGFPLLTTKKVNFNAIVHELIWILQGSTNIKYLTDNEVKIWNEWADEKGELGPIYGKQWRNWNGIDQIAEAQKLIIHDPNSRRIIVNSWNVSELKDMKLPPCHCFFQFYVANGYLNLQLYQRSADIFLGVPFNIASYSLLLHMMAQTTGLKPGTFIQTFGDVHLYKNHKEQALEQIRRVPYEFPDIELNNSIKNITDFKFEDIKLCKYQSHGIIKAPVAV